MSKKVFKFESRDTIKFIEIYRKYESLWDTEHVNYKSRGARSTTLLSFAKEFGVNGFGPKEITAKIKKLRTQYHAERRKIIASMDTESESGSVYKPKLNWYSLMDSFLLKTHEDREMSSLEPDLYHCGTEDSYPIDSKEDPIAHYENENSLTGPDNTLQYNADNSEDEDVKYFATHIEIPCVSPEFQTLKRPSISNYEQPSYDTLETEKRPKLENIEDDLESFGKYVTSSLRTLSAKNCIHAQDEIQSILTKYKIRNLNKRRNSTRRPESCSSDNDEK